MTNNHLPVFLFDDIQPYISAATIWAVASEEGTPRQITQVDFTIR